METKTDGHLGHSKQGKAGISNRWYDAADLLRTIVWYKGRISVWSECFINGQSKEVAVPKSETLSSPDTLGRTSSMWLAFRRKRRRCTSFWHVPTAWYVSWLVWLQTGIITWTWMQVPTWSDLMHPLTGTTERFLKAACLPWEQQRSILMYASFIEISGPIILDPLLLGRIAKGTFQLTVPAEILRVI